ncbi:MAG TPA: hypothetical protein VD789_05075, partial [Thermomicrobiales bacterium]|nr:hypothetical protein [Thermomicrobiales bacterium]
MPSLTRRHIVGTALAMPFLPARTVAARASQPASTPGPAWPMPGWPAASPEEVAIDPALPELLASATAAAPSVTAVVVTRYGRIAANYVAPGWALDDPIDIRSCTKSFVSALVGRARHEGSLSDLSVTIGDLIPERIPAGA